ncbi:hypothetical protein YC2023_071226 [Brassica napus]
MRFLTGDRSVRKDWFIGNDSASYGFTVSSGGLVWPSEAVQELKRAGVMALGSVSESCGSTELKAAALILVSSLSVPHCLSLCRLTRVWGSNMLSHRCPVLGGHKCGGGSRGSLITSVSSVWYWRQPHMVVAVKSTRLLQCLRRDSGVYKTSYAKGDSKSPGIRGKEENLTFSGSSLMVENIN